jgi:MYXO-CTERM domain-containing protein
VLEADFTAGDARLTERLAGSSLTAASRDFGFFAGDENYDLFYSDANGTLNPSGGYLTIEANCGVPYNCHNIDAVALQISGESFYATAVTHVTYSGSVSFPGTEGNILGAPNGNWTALGDTIGLPADARLSITVSFDTAPVPEPQTWATLALGLAAIGQRLRRRR